jgi:DNA-binding MarR family transcriptional regulator
MSQLVKDITEVARCGAQYRADRLASMGLKGCHASYLEEICADPGISQDKLAQRIFINKSNVARQIVVLEEDGFVTRTPSQSDKRIMELYPTEKTRQLLPQIKQILNSFEDWLTQDLTEQEAAIVANALVKMKARASACMDCMEEK